jgi:hypothetical protein
MQLYSTSAGSSRNRVKKGVNRAEETVNDAQMAVKRAQERLHRNLEMLDQWKAANPECTGEEVRFKFLKGEVDSANAYLNNASSLYLKLTGKGNYPSRIAFLFNH